MTEHSPESQCSRAAHAHPPFVTVSFMTVLYAFNVSSAVSFPTKSGGGVGPVFGALLKAGKRVYVWYVSCISQSDFCICRLTGAVNAQP